MNKTYIDAFFLICLFHVNSFRTSYSKLPRLHGHEVDLYLLYSLVTSRGGWERVNFFSIDVSKECLYDRYVNTIDMSLRLDFHICENLSLDFPIVFFFFNFHSLF